MKVYTKTGDYGTTSLISGERVSKNDPRVEAYGTVDELTAFIALLRDSIAGNEKFGCIREDLRLILNNLMNVEALLAMGRKKNQKVPEIASETIAYLEDRIDEISSELPPITKFTLPGGSQPVSMCHICRTVCRRAEREAHRAGQDHDISGNVFVYLNRLSDYFYVLGRKLCMETGAEEILWEPDK